MRRLSLALLLAAVIPGFAFAQSRPMNLATVNGSTTITAGNTFQTVLAAKANRQSVTIQNNNTNGDNCWVFIGAFANGSTTATAATSILLAPGGSYQRYAPYVPSDAIQATCAANNDTLYIDTN